MPPNQLIDTYAAKISAEKRASVMDGTSSGTEKRYNALFNDYEDPDAIHKVAAQIKQHTLEHLGTYLEQAEKKLTDNGVNVHFASTDQDAREAVLNILK